MVITKTSRDFPYKVLTKSKMTLWQTQWCEQHFGPRWSVTENRSGIWCCFWLGPRANENAGKYEWSFLHEKDAIYFSLVWV